MAKYLILSCDGGGIRGYLSSLILQRLDQECHIFGSNNNDNINLYAGTSTGGLIALALAFGKGISDVVNLYATDGPKIFNKLGLQGDCLLTVKKQFAAREQLSVEDIFDDVEELWQVLYDNTNASGVPSLQSVIQGFIPGNPKLSNLANSVAVATFQLSPPGENQPQWAPLVIDNLPNSAGADTYLYDAALSTSAAPVYFPPYRHPSFGWCADGGIFANNPAALAIARVIQSQQAQLGDIAMLSIGTGSTNASMPVNAAKRLCYGLKYWAWLDANPPTPAFAILNAMFDGSSESNDWVCSQLLGANYMRVNATLHRQVPLNGDSPQDLKILLDAAKAFIHSSAWQPLKDWVNGAFQH